MALSDGISGPCGPKLAIISGKFDKIFDLARYDYRIY